MASLDLRTKRVIHPKCGWEVLIVFLIAKDLGAYNNIQL